MTDLPRAHLSHSAPGRARLKIVDRRKDARFFAEAAERMLGAPGVERVEANPLTGSMLLVHSGELGPVLEFAREQGVFALAGPEAAPPLAHRLYGDIQAMNRALSRGTGGQIDLNMAVLMLFVVASVVQFFRGQVFGPSSTLLWYASTLLATRAAASGSGDEGG